MNSFIGKAMNVEGPIGQHSIFQIEQSLNIENCSLVKNRLMADVRVSDFLFIDFAQILRLRVNHIHIPVDESQRRIRDILLQLLQNVRPQKVAGS